MAKTAVLNKADRTLIKVVDTAEEKKEFNGREDVIFMVSKNFEPTEQFKTWEEMIGKVKPAEEGAEKAARAPTASLSGPYYIVKPLPPTAEDHPKFPIWKAVIDNDGKTCEDAKAACPKENPKRKTSGVYTFSSEMRYFVKTGYVKLEQKPEGYDFNQYAKPAKAEGEAKPKKSKKEKEAAEASASQNTTTEGAQA